MHQTAELGHFVAATGYVTEAKRIGRSFVFQLFLTPILSAPAPPDAPWWRKIDGAIIVTDGHFTYHRYPENPADEEIYQTTLMPPQIWDRLSVEKLQSICARTAF